MAFHEETLDSFLSRLSSNAPVPGGGGASALAGAIAVSLARMLAALTVGKPKYASVEDEMQQMLTQTEAVRERFLALMDEDADAFTPLAAAYRLPKDTPEQKKARTRSLEAALKRATEPPLKIMEACGDALKLIAVCAEKGSSLAVSDAGVAATLCRAALEGASLNVFVNTHLMQEREYAESLNSRARRMLADYGEMAQALYRNISTKLDG